MMNGLSREHAGTVGWGLVAAGVAAWDYLAPETLSAAFERSQDKHPILTLGALAIVSAHLLDILPDRVDPIHLLGKASTRAKGRST